MADGQRDVHLAFEAEYADFHDSYPAFEGKALDELRANEYGRLDRYGHIYLDYTGGGLYAESQLQQHFSLLGENVFGNPHSINPTSHAMTNLVESARAFVLEYFNASPDDYVAIFTPNASGALKLVGESYPFGPGDRYLLTYDNHNSVIGICEFARMKGASIVYAPVSLDTMRIDRALMTRMLGEAHSSHANLFAFPAQSNFSGAQHPLELIEEAHGFGWDVLLDAAAFAPTNRLNLGRWKPEFVTLSFYKMFGYPTGVGCLLARKSALSKLIRPWFAGGTIRIASVQADGHFLAEGEAAFEDGTINYLAFPAVRKARDLIASGALGKIYHFWAMYLQDWLLPHFKTPYLWRHNKEISGTGALGDFSHIIDIGHFLLGSRIQYVQSMLKNFIGERILPDGTGSAVVDVDDAFTSVIEFENGAIGTLEGTRLASGRKNYHVFEVNGEKGSIAWNLERLNELEIQWAEGEPAEFRGFQNVLVTEGSDPWIKYWWPPGHVIGWEHTFIHEIHHLLNCIVNDKDVGPERASFEDGHNACVVADAMVESSETGRKIECHYQ